MATKKTAAPFFQKSQRANELASAPLRAKGFDDEFSGKHGRVGNPFDCLAIDGEIPSPTE
jgi:hypothetical protein